MFTVSATVWFSCGTTIHSVNKLTVSAVGPSVKYQSLNQDERQMFSFTAWKSHNEEDTPIHSYSKFVLSWSV